MPTYQCSAYGHTASYDAPAPSNAATCHAFCLAENHVSMRGPVLRVNVLDANGVATEWEAFMGYGPLRVVNCVPKRGSTLPEAVDSMLKLGKAMSRVVIVDADLGAYLLCAPPADNGAVYHIATLRDGVLTVNCRPVHVGVYDRGTVDIGHLLPSVG